MPLAVEIRKDGRAHGIRATESAGHGLAGNPVETVQQRRRCPGTKAGAPVKAEARIGFWFRLLQEPGLLRTGSRRRLSIG